MKRALVVAVTFLASALAAVPAAAQEPPPSRLKLIFVERFRFEAWDNAVSLDDTAADASAYTRNRTTLGLSWKAAGNLEILGKVTNEFRVYLAPKDRAFNWHELFVDNLYIKWTLPGRVPFTVTAGRQDLNFGEGFVIADGTPGDGSRSYYFNALRLDADLAKGHRLTVFAHATKATDRYLPVVNPRAAGPGRAAGEGPGSLLRRRLRQDEARRLRRPQDDRCQRGLAGPGADRHVRGQGRDGPLQALSR